MTLKNRLAQLEKQTQPPAVNPYMTIDLQELYARAWQAVEDGKTITPQDTNPATEAITRAALPAKQLRRSRVFTALAVASSMLFVAGIASTARDGFSFKNPSPENAVLLGGALGSVAFAVVAGVLLRRAGKGYDRAVDVYNDSLGVRLGVMTPQGDYIPPSEVEVDAEGFVVTVDRLAPGSEGPQPATQPTQPTQPSRPAIAPPPSSSLQAPATEVQPFPVAPAAAASPAPPARLQARLQPGALLAAPPPAVRPVGALTLRPQR